MPPSVMVAVVVNRWLHCGPLLIIGRSGGPSRPAHATLTGAAGRRPLARGPWRSPLYFSHAGSVTLRLPVSHA
jgi:hypothetical protein